LPEFGDAHKIPNSSKTRDNVLVDVSYITFWSRAQESCNAIKLMEQGAAVHMYLCGYYSRSTSDVFQGR
jgi:hypothetical protein